MSISSLSNRPMAARPSFEAQKPSPPQAASEKNLGSAPAEQASTKHNAPHQADAFDKVSGSAPTAQAANKNSQATPASSADKNHVEKASKHVETQQAARHSETQQAAKELAQLQSAQQATPPMVRDLAA